MGAHDEQNLDSLSESRRLVIHTYQRIYRWMERTRRQFWNQMMRTGGNDVFSVYFVGSTVYVESAHHPLFLAINQQQFLITVMQLPAAVAMVVKGKVPANRYSSSTMRKYDLINLGHVGIRFSPFSDEAVQRDFLSRVEPKTRPTSLSTRLARNVGFSGKEMAKRG